MAAEVDLLTVVPMTIARAKTVCARWHRHNKAPQSGLFAVGANSGDELVGIAIVGRPSARALQDGVTCEITRVATNGCRNACSLLYGACCRAARALGYKRIVTYTLQSESGVSLRASGFQEDARLDARPTWSTQSRPRVQTNLFGEEQRPSGPKIRWVKKWGWAQP
jgi:hypothetical protein